MDGWMADRWTHIWMDGFVKIGTYIIGLGGILKTFAAAAPVGKAVTMFCCHTVPVTA